ncbi:metallophosphoesterase family protein [Spirosoma validum]|uniref:Metallophosphoesterase n=1 Tax=Spirosoma validum TaxID=2771355 RepID=A0A927AZW5_9BACT|nr:metallophosphoesterase [Spirosoma validum]MBD2752835.1 metallophosphoesterase [Spirosoma validum]
MRIAFITDMHLGAEGEKIQGVDVRQNFLDALAYLTEVKPNCLVIGGDISNTVGDRSIYEWVRKQIDDLPFQYYVIPGNHDDSALIAEVFRMTHDLHDNELYYALPLEGRPTLFLDSSKGDFSPEQWTWFRDYLIALRDTNVLIFMHHSPIPADVLFMDTRYPFREPTEFLELVKDLPCHVTVVCGHYHVEKEVQRGNLLVLLSPSTFYQMKHDTPEFAIDNYRIGIREIDLTTHGTISTVHYVEPKSV